MQRKPYLTGKAFRMFIGSSILTALSAMLGNIVDGIIVSHLIDYNAMSATSLSKPIIQGNYTFYQLVGLGACILVAKALGNNDHKRANGLFSMAIVVLLLFGLAETAVGILCPGVVVDAVCTADALRDYSMQYFVPLLVGTPLFMAVYFLGGFTAIDGAPKLVSVAMVIDNAVNLTMDVVLIEVFDMGVSGSSIATLIGHATACAIMLSHYCGGKSQFVFQWNAWRSLARLRDACGSGMPFAVASVCMTIYLYSTQSIISGALGHDKLFIFSVMLNIMTIYNMFVSGSCATMQQLAALQLGMGDNYGHRHTVYTAFRFLNISLAVACAVMCIAPQLVAGMFDCPEELMAECCGGVRIYGVAFWLFCVLYLLMVNYKLLRESALANFISFFLNLSVIPVMWLMATQFPDMVWWSNLFAYVAVAIVVLSVAWVKSSRDKNVVPVLLLPRTAGNQSADFSFAYADDAMHSTFDQMSQWLKARQLSTSTIFKVRVVAEELMSNITRHSQQKNANAYADVRIVIADNVLTLSVCDDGKPFNPIENKDKGYGLMIANGLASDIFYRYQFGQNMTMVKINLKDEEC